MEVVPVRTRAIRRPVYVWLPVAGGVGTYALAALFIGPLHEAPGGAVLLGGVTLFFWALGWDSAIRSGPDRLSVTNFLVTSSVAWTDVGEVAVHDGLTVVLRDGRTIESIAFGSSVLGTFTGYPTHQKALRRLRQAHRAALRTHGGTGTGTETGRGNGKGRGKGRGRRKDRGPAGPVRLTTTFEWRRLLCALVAVYGPLLLIGLLAR
ncbi:hypothetical protein ACFYWP_41010 [Actinacidiphila glaucinigra]|uniref:hypothetical protein n=1 Tax=Actinacidiphila glaucinigra TaxID=235986 RepID=UPI0036C766DF